MVKNHIQKRIIRKDEWIMPRRGECIYKRKDGRWEARYVKEVTPDGKKKYGSVYADSYSAVKDKQQYMQQMPRKKKLCCCNIKMEQLLFDWLDHIKTLVKLSSYCKYESLCNNHILPHLGSITLTEISRNSVELFARNQRASGRIGGGSLSVKTVNDILTVLRLAFEFAEEEYDTRMPKITYLREERQEARVLSIQEQQILSSYLLKDMDATKFACLLALYTGLRIGEVCALQWADISEKSITVNKTLQRLALNGGKTQIFITPPKSDFSKRVVPLPRFLLPYVTEMRRGEGYVLSTARCDHSEPRALQQGFRKIATGCGLENITFHTLRHTFATRCVEAGFDIKTLSEILGHADVKTTLNRYVHSSFEFKEQNMAKLTLKVNV